MLKQPVIPNSLLRMKKIKPVLILSNLLKLKDIDTYSHSLRVAELSYLIANQMKLPEIECEIVYLSAVYHDIGKLFIPQSILTKPTKLTYEEFQNVKNHSKFGWKVLKQFKCLEEHCIHENVLFHHERYDGKGYPCGLKESEIPLAARIVSVADSFDAMVSKRAYKSSQCINDVKNELVENCGIQFDPNVVRGLLNLMKSKKMKPYLVA